MLETVSQECEVIFLQHDVNIYVLATATKRLYKKNQKKSSPPSSDNIHNRSTASAPGTPPKACFTSTTSTMQAGDHPKQPIGPSAWCRSHHRSSQCHASSISAKNWFVNHLAFILQKKMQSISDINLQPHWIHPNWWKFHLFLNNDGWCLVLQPRLQQLQIITTQLFWWMNRLRPWK